MNGQDDTWEGRAVRAEAERDRAMELAETAMRIMSDEQLIEMRKQLDRPEGENGDQPGEARTRAAG